MGTTSLTARAFGQNDNPVQVLQQALWLVAPVLILVLGCALIAVPLLLPLMGGSADIQSGAREYLLIRLCAAPAVLGQYVLTGWFIGLGRTRIPLIVLTVANLLNAVLDYFFVFHLQILYTLRFLAHAIPAQGAARQTTFFLVCSCIPLLTQMM